MEGFDVRTGYWESDSMSNVISFPKHSAKAQPQHACDTGSKTLFVHIRNTTMIVHLAAQVSVTAAGGRVGKP